MLHHRLEEVALNAWPALRQVLLDGWILRLSDGYTKRANSVNPLYGSQRPAMVKIGLCEQLYTSHGLPTIFRLTPQVLPHDLDDLLAQRGYVIVDPSLVMHLDLGRGALHRAAADVLHAEAFDDWLAAFCRLSGSAPDRQQTHRLLLQAIPCERLLVTLSAAGQVVACGLGVLESDCFGLFDLITAPPYRNLGHGTTLVAAMLDWARQRGAVHAYLQVVRSNAPARHLYTKLGFLEAFPYWYRVRA